MEELAFRQIHLDFHTSGEIPGVADDFDASEFVEVLREARVNSVTCFAKCHHGYSYYPTQIGVRHPQLKRDLLGEQVEACHRAGIRVPAYLTVVWDEHAAASHQEWLQIDRQGREVGRGPLDVYGWRWLCMNTTYADYVAAQTEEVLRRYPVDGIFFDIVKQTEPGCVCDACRRRLASRGLDLADDDALRDQSLEIARDFMHRMTALVHGIRPESSVFYNSRLRVSADPQRGMRHELPYYTHVEIESLPSGAWGYNHYPLFARSFQPFGKDVMGMTARFHKSWADFGGLKNQAALEYECFAMLATAAKCSIGDQLHPHGRLERPAYEQIGAVYQSVEAKEPWCRGAEALAEIGVVLAEGRPGVDRQAARDTDEGALRILLETGRTFHFLDVEAELSDYRLVLLPDCIRIGPLLAQKLRDYLMQGGNVVLCGESGLDPAGQAFALKELGLRSSGPSPWTTAYVRVGVGPLGRDIAPLDHVVYERGWAVEAEPDTETLAAVVAPYFNRDHLHFMSHAQTPPAIAPGAPLPDDSPPAVTRRGATIYLAFPLCRAYRRHGNRVYKTLLRNAIDLLLPERLIAAGLPSSGQVTLLRQPDAGGRVIAHLLYYPSERRTPQIDIVEDVVPLRDVLLAARPGFRPQRVYEVPSQAALPFTWDNGVVSLTLPRLNGHAMVVFEP
ncbi:MAG: alpha-amylase family protein [Chloroflexota bacterium]